MPTRRPKVASSGDTPGSSSARWPGNLSGKSDIGESSAPPAALASASHRLVRLARATSLAERGLRRALHQQLRPLELSDAELQVLWTCARHGDSGVAQNQLADEVGVSAAQASNLLDGLRRGGLVASHRDDTDRRRQFWRLEPAGEQVLSTALASLGDLAARVLQQMTPTEQTVLEELLTAVRNAASQHAAGQHAAEQDGRAKNGESPPIQSASNPRIPREAA